MVSEMKEKVCIVSNEIVLKYLDDCLKILANTSSDYNKKIKFMTPHAIIGREFDNILYINPSYTFSIDSKTNDIIHSDIINVCSRPKNQLGIIDFGTENDLHDKKQSGITPI